MLNSIFASGSSISGILVMVAAAMIAGMLVSMIFGYKNAQSRSFALTLSLLPMVSAFIIFMVNDHLGVSVAVAGAFTLVRFRSVAGSGRELIAIFSAMMLGLVLGMGYIGIAAVALLAIAVMVLFLSKFGLGAADRKTVKIRIPEDLEYAGLFDDVFKKYTDSYQLVGIRTKNMGTLYELTFTASFKEDALSKKFMDAIRVRNGNLLVSITDFAQNESI